MATQRLEYRGKALMYAMTEGRAKLGKPRMTYERLVRALASRGVRNPSTGRQYNKSNLASYRSDNARMPESLLAIIAEICEMPPGWWQPAETVPTTSVTSFFLPLVALTDLPSFSTPGAYPNEPRQVRLSLGINNQMIAVAVDDARWSPGLAMGALAILDAARTSFLKPGHVCAITGDDGEIDLRQVATTDHGGVVFRAHSKRPGLSDLPRDQAHVLARVVGLVDDWSEKSDEINVRFNTSGIIFENW